MNPNFINIKLIIFVLGGWSCENVNSLTVINDYTDRSTTGITFHRHNNERSQLPFLPVYYPNHIWRRKRVHLFPSKKYPYRTIYTLNQNHKRYFPLHTLPGAKNSKWSNYMLSYLNFLKTTPRTSYYMLSEERRANLHNREQYFNIPILSTISPLQNNCVNRYNLNTAHANTLTLCTEKLSTVPNNIQKGLLNKAEFISNASQFETTTRTPYRHNFDHNTGNTYMYNVFHATAMPNSLNTSHIYFTIGDAITTPQTILNHQFKLFRNYGTIPNGNQSIVNYKMQRLHTTTPVIWTMDSIPTSLSQISNNTVNISISDNETKKKSKYTYVSDNSSIDSTKPNWIIDQTMNNNCSNPLIEINKNCIYGDKQNLKDYISKISPQTTISTIESYPIKTTMDLETSLTPITELPYLNNAVSTAIWNVVEASNISTEKAQIFDNTSHRPPVYRRSKIVQINKRLVYKEGLSNKNRNIKTTALPIPIKLSKSKTREKGQYISSSHSPSLQSTPSPKVKEQMLSEVTVGNSNVKKTKNRFQNRNRLRWAPSNEKRLGKVNNIVSTSSTIATVLSSSTQTVPQRNKITNKFTRSKLRQHKLTNIVEINSTRNVIDLQLLSTTSLANSTPESAIMRISNISGEKTFFAKNNIANSLDNLPNASNAFIAELPIVTYFKEVTESRKV